MRRGNRSRRDHWQMHFNDWLDNGTFYNYEEMEDRPESRVPDPEIKAKEQRSNTQPKVPVRAIQSTKSDLKNTGRFDQFNEEFDGNFNMHSVDMGSNVQDDETPSRGSVPDEYRDEDPYKLIPGTE